MLNLPVADRIGFRLYFMMFTKEDVKPNLINWAIFIASELEKLLELIDFCIINDIW